SSSRRSPFKLYEMLKYARASGVSSSISWLADGTGFVIHNKDAMMNDLTPMFFNQTKFRSFVNTTAESLGFLRTNPRGNNWKHKDFLRERPDLLKEIVRISVKSKSAMKVNMRTSSSRSSNIKATASSQSAGSKRAAKVKSKRVNIEMERVVAANERSSPSSHSRARADSNPTQFSYDYDDGSADASAAMVASPDVQSHNQDSVSLSSSVQPVGDNDEATKMTATTTTQTQVASTQQKAEANTTHRSSDQQQQAFPFKLYEMLEYARASGVSSSISWLADGTGFVIHNKDAMMNDLTPMFFNQTKFRSFTRQLNLWGFLRTNPRGDNWKHKDFLRERPDLLKEIVRISVKSKSAMKVNMRMSSSRSSNIKATASSQSAGSKRAAEVKGKRVNIEAEKVVVADERVFPSSHSQARADSNPTQFSYNYDDGSAAASAAVVALPELRFHFHAPQCQDSVFQYCSSNMKYDVQSHNQDSVSLSSSVQPVGDNDEATNKTATTTTQTQVASTQQKAEANTTHRSSDECTIEDFTLAE
ncbi:heat shock factor family protein, partial [Skeletonema marinoi]